MYDSPEAHDFFNELSDYNQKLDNAQAIANNLLAPEKINLSDLTNKGAVSLFHKLISKIEDLKTETNEDSDPEGRRMKKLNNLLETLVQLKFNLADKLKFNLEKDGPSELYTGKKTEEIYKQLLDHNNDKTTLLDSLIEYKKN